MPCVGYITDLDPEYDELKADLYTTKISGKTSILPLKKNMKNWFSDHGSSSNFFYWGRVIDR